MLSIVFGFALLASAISVNKVLLATFPPFFLVGIRMLFGGAILTGLFYAKQRIPFQSLLKDWKQLTVMALLTTFFQSTLKSYALKHMLSSKAALIGSLDPFVTAILAYLLLSERLSTQKLCGILLGMVGFITLTFSTSSLEGQWHLLFIFSLPELAAFFAMIFGRYGWIQAQKFLKQRRYAPAELNGIMMLISGVSALLCSLFLEQPTLAHATWQTVPLMLYTIIIGNVVAYTMYAHFLQAYSAGFVSLAGFSVPVFVTLYGTLFLSEAIFSQLIYSGLIILAGVALFYQDELRALAVSKK